LGLTDASSLSLLLVEIRPLARITLFLVRLSLLGTPFLLHTRVKARWRRGRNLLTVSETKKQGSGKPSPFISWYCTLFSVDFFPCLRRLKPKPPQHPLGGAFGGWRWGRCFILLFSIGVVDRVLPILGSFHSPLESSRSLLFNFHDWLG